MTAHADIPSALKPDGSSGSPLYRKLLVRAQREWAQQRLADLARTVDAMFALVPDDPAAMWLSGMAAQRLGEHGHAVGCFQRALLRWPDDSDLHMDLGRALCARGDAEAGIAAMRQACSVAPDSAEAWFHLGEALSADARAEAAIEALQKARDLDPQKAGIGVSLAQVFAVVGQVDEASREFRRVLQREPGYADAWLGLSNLNIIRFDAADTEQLRAAWETSKCNDTEHERIGFSYARALEDRGDHAAAFDVLAEANALRHRRSSWKAASERRLVDAIRNAFAGEVLASPDADAGHEVIFIAGTPRSGTTLVEQILASHPEVEGANELKALPSCIGLETRRGRGAFPLWVPGASADDWRRLGHAYLEETARWRTMKSHSVDKNLTNWLLVGAALSMLPAARVVIVRRDPVETCLACYRQYFGEPIEFAYDLRNLAAYYANFLALTRFWRERYPDRVLDLEYETLVAQPEATIGRLLDFCGLPPSRECLEFHKTRRAVFSVPSAAQVREPLRAKTARSALYGSKLDPLREYLRDAGVLPQRD
ncbi:MAG TPA: tetratricopeptide repeat protein [Rudaea sp.]|nr:tetratricopeptide repeat protein [Rudaea sp.]